MQELHYARSCPSRAEPGVTGNQVKVNLAVMKINTRAKYNQYLPEARITLGSALVATRMPILT